MSNFGKVLKSLRNNKKMTQDELAKMLSISKSSISSYEQASRFPPSAMLINIADVFNVSTDYLLGRAQKWRVLDTSGLKDEDVELLCTIISFLRAKNKIDGKLTLT